MKHAGACLLLLVLSTACSAAILQSAYSPPAGGAGRDVPVNRQNRERAPIPAPAPTDHYAIPQVNTWTLL